MVKKTGGGRFRHRSKTPGTSNNYNTINHYASNGLIEKTGSRTNRPDFNTGHNISTVGADSAIFSTNSNRKFISRKGS